MLIPKGKKPGRTKPRRKPDKAHFEKIATTPCCCCGKWPVHVHHLLRIELGMLLKYPGRHQHSAGKKAHDAWAIPLCPDCHLLGVHGPEGETAFLERHGVDGPRLAEKLYGKD